MPQKRTKRTATAAKVTAVERAARVEEQTLRRVNRQQRRIVELSQRLTRSVRKADTDRIVAARALVDGTEYGVFGLAETSTTVQRLREAEVRIKALDRMVREMSAPAGNVDTIQTAHDPYCEAQREQAPVGSTR